jgi:hypothetical protein
MHSAAKDFLEAVSAIRLVEVSPTKQGLRAHIFTFTPSGDGWRASAADRHEGYLQRANFLRGCWRKVMIVLRVRISHLPGDASDQ